MSGAATPGVTKRGRASRLVWVSGALWLCACTTAPAVESQCGNGGDDDGDDLADCDDSDCQASDECVGPRISQVKPPRGGAPHDLDGGDKPMDAMLGDSWSGDSPDATPPEDGQIAPPIDEDGGTDSCPVCATNEACVDGVCQSAAAPSSGAYNLRLLGGAVPSMNDIGFCYDACGFIPAGACLCAPDPYVIIFLGQGEAAERVGMTEPVSDTLSPRFPPLDFPIDLAAGDVLRFDVYDYDQPDRDNFLYTCNADLRGVSAEAPKDVQLSCVGLGGIAMRVPYEIVAQLSPRPAGP